MLNKFISNVELVKLLELATDEEKLALTKILDKNKITALDSKKLQEKISKEGGHGVVNFIRGQGTGYLDILDDVADTLKINDKQSYNTSVKYFEEMYYIKNKSHNTIDSKVEKKYNIYEAKTLNLEYTSKLEEKVIAELIRKSYELMLQQKKDAEENLQKLKLEKNILEQILNENIQKSKIKVIDTVFEDGVWIKKAREYIEPNLKNKINDDTKNIEILKLKIEREENIIIDTGKKINDFDSAINEVSKKFNTNDFEKLTGTAGIMAIANLGGFATYTLLTSMMSVVSMGTLGFGAYTAATTLLSIIIGPVGWAGLGIFTIFSIGKPNMSKMILIIATIGAIRQRIKYEKKAPSLSDEEIKKFLNQNVLDYIIAAYQESNDVNNNEEIFVYELKADSNGNNFIPIETHFLSEIIILGKEVFSDSYKEYKMAIIPKGYEVIKLCRKEQDGQQTITIKTNKDSDIDVGLLRKNLLSGVGKKVHELQIIVEMFYFNAEEMLGASIDDKPLSYEEDEFEKRTALTIIERIKRIESKIAILNKEG